MKRKKKGARLHVAIKPTLNKRRKKKEHVCRIIFLDFHVCREGSGVNSEKKRSR